MPGSCRIWWMRLVWWNLHIPNSSSCPHQICMVPRVSVILKWSWQKTRRWILDFLSCFHCQNQTDQRIPKHSAFLLALVNWSLIISLFFLIKYFLDDFSVTCVSGTPSLGLCLTLCEKTLWLKTQKEEEAFFQLSVPQHGCGGLNENGSYIPMKSGTIRRGALSEWLQCCWRKHVIEGGLWGLRSSSQA